MVATNNPDPVYKMIDKVLPDDLMENIMPFLRFMYRQGLQQVNGVQNTNQGQFYVTVRFHPNKGGSQWHLL